MDKKEFMPHIKLINTPQLVTEAKEIMKEFSKALLRNLKTRFVVDEIVVLFQVLIIENIRSSNVDIALYGIQEIDKLIDIFGISKTVDKVETQPIIDPIETRSEWRLFKRFIKNNYLDETNEIFWSRIANNLTFKNQYPNIHRLGYIANILPMSTSICERGFSTMNRIKDESRNKIGNS